MANVSKLYKAQVVQPVAMKKTVLSNIASGGHDALVRNNTFMSEIIWGNQSRLFPERAASDNVIFRKRMFLFNMVRKDADAFLKKNGKIKLPKEYPGKFDTGKRKIPRSRKMMYTDLNHAYWRIAYNLGIISENTYKKGLPPATASEREAKIYKDVSLATLSTLGAGKKYSVIRDGKMTDQVVHVNANQQMANIYKLIRFSCYWYMTHLKRKLGADFIKYEIDAIFYMHSESNLHMVERYLTGKKLLFKHVLE